MPITFLGATSGPVILGNDATTQTLFCVENGIASRVNVLIRELDLDIDTIAALATVMPQIKASRGTGISGGILLPKSGRDANQVSDPAVQFRCPLGEGAPIVATPGTIIHQKYLSRAHTVAEQFVNPTHHVAVNGVLPFPITDKNFVLRPGQNLVVQLLGATAASNAALANAFTATCTWEEDQISTFAISGTVTLSGSPVAGAIVTVIEADDIDMTNAVLRDKIVTPAGGTWASSIRTGKVGAAFVQYRVGSTYYTAPGSPYLQ